MPAHRCWGDHGLIDADLGNERLRLAACKILHTRTGSHPLSLVAEAVRHPLDAAENAAGRQCIPIDCLNTGMVRGRHMAEVYDCGGVTVVVSR